MQVKWFWKKHEIRLIKKIKILERLRKLQNQELAPDKEGTQCNKPTGPALVSVSLSLPEDT